MRFLLAAGLAACAAVVQAQDAGSVLKTIPAEQFKLNNDLNTQQQLLKSTQAITDVEGMKIDIKDFKISGLTVVKPEILKPALQQFIGPNKKFQDLLDAASVVRRELASRGFFLTDAIIPKQKIENSIVEIMVIEGRIGKVKVEYADDVKIHRALIDGYVSELNSGDIVSAKSVERALFLISDLNGLDSKSVLQPGDKLGTVDLIIKINKGKTLAFDLKFDNTGSIYTGVMRGGASFSVNNLAGFGDMFSASYLRSLDSDGLHFSRASYIASVGPWGSKLGASYSDLRYKLGTEIFDPIGASGAATVASLIGLHPLIRSRNANLMAMYQYDERKFHDVKLATKYEEDKLSTVQSLIFSGDLRDTLLGGGINVGNLALTHGDLEFPEITRSAVDLAGHHTQGGYDKVNLTFSRLQSVSHSTAVYFTYSTQMASKNLDGSEKISLGGPNAVRAYPQGEASGDEGYVASLELRYAWPPSQKIRGNLGLIAFYDWASSRVNKEPTANDLATPGFVNDYYISGTGVGVNWDVPNNFQMRATLAWRNTNPSVGEYIDRNPRLFFQANKRF